MQIISQEMIFHELSSIASLGEKVLSAECIFRVQRVKYGKCPKIANTIPYLFGLLSAFYAILS